MLGESAQRTITPVVDQDWFEIAVSDRHIYSFTAVGSIPLVIEVFAQDGVTLLAADNRGLTSAELAFVGSTQATMMVRVRALAASDTGAYEAQYLELGIDDYVESAAAAQTLVPASSRFRGNVQYAGDVDRVWFELPALTAVNLSMPDGVISPADAGSLHVMVEVSRADGGSRLLGVRQATIVTTPTVERLLLTARSGDPRGVGSFDLSFSILGADDHSDECAFGTALFPGSSASGRLDRADDSDCFKMTQQTGRLYRAWRDTLGPLPELRVSPPAGPRLISPGSAPVKGVVWQAARSGEVSLEVGYSSLTGATYGISVEDLGFDDHPEAPPGATPAIFGAPVAGRLELPEDVDTFSFTPAAGQVFKVTAIRTSAGSTVTPWVVVRAPTGLVIAEGSGEVTTIAASSGVHWAQVTRQVGSSTNTDLLSYLVTVSDLGSDDHAGTSSGATPLAVGTPTGGSVQFSSDLDAFSLPVIANHVYRVACDRAGGCWLSLRDPSGQVVHSGLASVISFFATTGSAWALEVTAGPNLSSPVLGSYNLTLTDLGPEDHGATLATASSLPVDTPVSANLAFQNDVDVFSFSTQPGRVYAVTTTGSAIMPEVRDANDQVVVSAFGPPASFLASAGTYFVVIRVVSMLGPYTVVVVDRGPDDHANSSAGATALAPGTQAMGVLQYQNDVDVFSTPVEVGHHHRVSVSNGANVWVRTPSGVSLVSGSSGASFKTPAGVASVLVQISGIEGTTYNVTVTDLGADDHGETAADATPLVVGGAPLNGSLLAQGDVDAFVVTASAGEVINLNCVSTSNVACALHVTSPSGAQVAQVGIGATVRTGFFAATTGPYLVTVGGQAGSSFTLSAIQSSDDVTTTTPVSVGSSRAGSIDYFGDTDTFSVALTQGSSVHLALSTTALAGVTSPTGSYVMTLAGGSTYVLTASITGPYVITVSSAQAGANVNYTLFVQ